MRIYLDLVVLLNFLVDFLLLLGTNRLCGFPVGAGRAALGAAVGGVYAGLCLVPGFAFLGGWLWRLVSLGIMGSLAFGWNMGAFRRGVIFVLLAMALGGIALGLGSGGFWSLAAAAGGVCVLCAVGFRGRVGQQRFVPVHLRYGNKQLQLLALEDTGNTLRDPVTGEPVLVLSAEAAADLTGLTAAQLRTPVETVAAGVLPGLRLLPYRAVGSSGGMLAALRLDDVRIDGRKAGTLAAFAPEGLDRDGTFQALTGGI